MIPEYCPMPVVHFPASPVSARGYVPPAIPATPGFHCPQCGAALLPVSVLGESRGEGPLWFLPPAVQEWYWRHRLELRGAALAAIWIGVMWFLATMLQMVWVQS